MIPMPVRLTEEQHQRLDALSPPGGDFTKQELIRLAIDRLFEALDAGEEIVFNKVLALGKSGAPPKASNRKPRLPRDRSDTPILVPKEKSKSGDEKTTPAKKQGAA
ncbi:MAG: hypothetical protein LBV12_07160 [Puniceicoccales bacterium]|nr:hypothetical protein [Puniceicoccales bacterium]